jgi:hypothetical protein
MKAKSNKLLFNFYLVLFGLSLLGYFYTLFDAYQKDKIDRKSPYCANKRMLIDENHLTTIDFDKDSVEVENLINRQTAKVNCWESIKLGFDYQMDKNKIRLPIQFYKECEDVVFDMPPLQNIYTINSKDKIFKNGEIISKKDFIKTLIVFNSQFYEENFSLYILFEGKIKNDRVQKICELLVPFYLSKLEEFSSKTYGKKICDISKTNLLELKNKYRFELNVGWEGRWGLIPPPPPPPIYYKKHKKAQ